MLAIHFSITGRYTPLEEGTRKREPGAIGAVWLTENQMEKCRSVHVHRLVPPVAKVNTLLLHAYKQPSYMRI